MIGYQQKCCESFPARKYSPCKHTVGVATDHEHVVLVSTFGLGDDIVVGPILANGLDEYYGGDRGGAVGLGEEIITGLLGDPNDRGVVAVGSKRTGETLAGDIVVDDGGGSTSGLGVEGLNGKGAGASGNERDIARDTSREISDLASQAVHLDNIALNIVRRWPIRQVVGRDIFAGNGELDGGGSKQLDEGLLVNLPVVVAETLQALEEPFRGAVMSQ